MTENRYTDKKYWEHYYQTSNIKIDRIKNIVGLYDQYWDKLVGSCKETPRTIIEIGAYPGRYLAYLSWKYNLQPTALDFNSDTTKIEDCFKSFNVSNYKFIQTDFLEFTTDKKYDLVISNGFVEHFENFEEVMDKHCDYLLPSGAMLIMIPNMRYLKKWYAGTLDSENLKIHNLKVMKLQVFRDFATRNNLKIELLTYFGGFPFTVHQKLNFFQKGIYQVFRRFFKLVNPVIMRYPNRFLSSSIIAIYTKK